MMTTAKLTTIQEFLSDYDKMLESRASKLIRHYEKTDLLSIADQQKAINLNRYRNNEEKDLTLMHEAKEVIQSLFADIEQLEKEIKFQHELFSQASKGEAFYIDFAIQNSESQQNLKAILRNQAKSILNLQKNTL